MSIGTDLNRVEQTILRLADSHSPEEISRELGGVIRPARVSAEASRLLASRSWLSAAQQDELVIWKLRRILSELEGQTTELDNAMVQLRLLKEIGNRLDKRREATQVDLNSYHVNVGREMARVYDIALGYMRGALRGEIDPELWDEISKDAMAHAQTELMKNAVDDEGNRAVTSRAA